MSNEKSKRKTIGWKLNVEYRFKLKGFGRINQSLVNRMADRCNETVKGKDTFTYKSSYVYEARITIPSPSRGILMIQICIDLSLPRLLPLRPTSFSFFARRPILPSFSRLGSPGRLFLRGFAGSNNYSNSWPGRGTSSALKMYETRDGDERTAYLYLSNQNFPSKLDERRDLFAE